MMRISVLAAAFLAAIGSHHANAIAQPQANSSAAAAVQVYQAPS